MADSALEAVVSDAPLAKKARMEVELEPTASQDVPAPHPHILPCAGSTDGTPCPNESALRCPHGACSGCCAVFQSALTSAQEGNAPVQKLCEHHLERARKDRERAENKRANAKARRKVGQEAKIKRKVEMEAKATEKESAMAGRAMEGVVVLDARAGAEETLRIETGRTEAAL